MKGVVIAGTGSGVGKTSITTGLIARLSKKYKVQAFKAGPDFIDPMYHSAASGRRAGNLDSFMMSDEAIRKSVGYAASDADICIVEGVRGLYESSSPYSDEGSTARLAKILGFPVILTVDVRSLNNSAAAIVNGFQAFDPDVRIEGLILNRISGKQHEDKIDGAMKRYCKPEVIGKVKKLPEKPTKERYLGLVTPSPGRNPDFEPLEEMVSDVDIDRLMAIAADAELPDCPEGPYVKRKTGLKAAVPLDDSFCFYYRENIDCLEASGINIEHFSPTEGDMLPDADMYLLGGGYPELHAEKISENKDLLQGLKNVSEEGKPVLGECGGMTAMCRSLKNISGEVFGMAGIFGAEAVMDGIRHGPTYVSAIPAESNPLFDSPVRAHEYRYSKLITAEKNFGYRLERGNGILPGYDGLVYKRSLGTYMHQNALSSADWAGGFVRACELVRQ